jgi:hypothetical protein
MLLVRQQSIYQSRQQLRCLKYFHQQEHSSLVPVLFLASGFYRREVSLLHIHALHHSFYLHIRSTICIKLLIVDEFKNTRIVSVKLFQRSHSPPQGLLVRCLLILDSAVYRSENFWT